MDDYWFTKNTKQILIDHLHIVAPSRELVKIADALVEQYNVAAWYKMFSLTEQQIIFAQNHDLWDWEMWRLMEFFETTKGNPNQKSIVAKVKEGMDLQDAIKASKTLAIDPSVLDVLEGKITEQKMVNWGVGQIMKAYPGKYSAAEIKIAIEQRYINK